MEQDNIAFNGVYAKYIYPCTHSRHFSLRFAYEKSSGRTGMDDIDFW